jgi:ubiquinone/menaquinone biosynthesis C-methylase UbiE
MDKEQTTKVPGGNELIDACSLLEKAGIEEKMKIADLGCGRRGYFTLQAAKLTGDQGLVYAVDILETSLEDVKSLANLFGLPNIKTIWADLEVLNSTRLPDSSIDLAMLNNVLFQTQKDELIIQEAIRILKKGGKLLITDWKKIKTPFGPPVENRTDPEYLKKYGQKQGLKLKKELVAGPYHYSLIFIKQ